MNLNNLHEMIIKTLLCKFILRQYRSYRTYACKRFVCASTTARANDQPTSMNLDRVYEAKQIYEAPRIADGIGHGGIKGTARQEICSHTPRLGESNGSITSEH